MPHPPGRRALAAALAALALAAALPARAGDVLDRVRASGTLRVCIWPDYYGISWRNPRTDELEGIDIDLSAAFAADLGVRRELVNSSFARLVEDLSSDRCDVSMHAIGITEARQRQLRFSRPYLRSDLYGVTTRANRLVRQWDDIDRPGVRVAVQAGTVMEPTMREALRQAELVIVAPPATREGELEAGRVDVFMTDYPYSRRVLATYEWAVLIEPPRIIQLTEYAYAVPKGDAPWLARVNAFVRQIRQDGRLAEAARRFDLLPIVVKD